MMSKRKAIIWPAVCILCFAALVTALGCAPKTTTAGDATSAATSSDSASATTAGGNTTVEKYASAYPLEYNSLMVTWTNANGKLIGHSLFRDICEAPLMRDMNGDVLANTDGTYAIAGFHYDAVSGQYVIDELTAAQLDEYGLYQGCVACKSSKFNDLYSSEGAAAFTAVYDADAREVVNGDYFDCALCHTGAPSANSLSANAMYWNALGAGLTENLDTKDQVCAQCHNSYDYRRSITTEADLQKDRPYRNGYDIDGLMQTCLEDGTNFDTDPDTGIMSSFLTHPDIEMYMGTKMQQMGVTCVDCHMTQSTDSSSGMAYTNHNATQSPLENPDALSKCLTCHKSQGVNSADEMVSFVRGKQATVAAEQASMEAKEAQFLQKLTDAIKGNTKDTATLEQAKTLYAKVTWYDCVLVSGPDEQPGAKVAMMDAESIVSKADQMCDEGLALLA